MKKKEIDDDKLKLKSKEWWSNHSQDYVNPGEIDHLGVPDNISDVELEKYLNMIDHNFKLDAYFAQSKDMPLFSNLFPNNLKNKKILEIGCGLGAHTEQLCKYGAKVTSIDISPKSIEITKRRLSLRNLKAEVIEADAENLPFSDNYFDYVWSWGVIHHTPNTIKCAQEIERVLKSGGVLSIMLYNRNSFYNWFNVIFRYGILKGKLLTMSLQDLKNRYTDGKALNGSPLAKYYSHSDVRNILFPNLIIDKQIAFEQKNAVSFFIPKKYKRKFESIIPDKLYMKFWSKFGFLLFSIAKKK